MARNATIALILIFAVIGFVVASGTPVWSSETGTKDITQVGQLQLKQQPPSAATGSNSTPYMVTLLETMGNEWNSTAPESQPKFFVAGPTGLESSANISLPAHRLIELVIISYDT